MDVLHEIKTTLPDCVLHTWCYDWHTLRSKREGITARYQISQMVMVKEPRAESERYSHHYRASRTCPTWQEVAQAHTDLLARGKAPA